MIMNLVELRMLAPEEMLITGEFEGGSTQHLYRWESV